MLNSLPASLDGTYERMLCKIDSHSVEDARRILNLVCFASRPLTVHEIIDGIAVRLRNDVGLDQKHRLQDANDIHGICSGLIEIGLDSGSSTKAWDAHDGPNLVQTVRIAHFSVQEYLESERIRHEHAAIFSLSSVEAHAEISHICLLYLLEPALSYNKPFRSCVEGYPLARYAAEFWYHHFQKAERPQALNSSISKLFHRQDSFRAWLALYDLDYDSSTKESKMAGSPVYYASLLGLEQVLYGLIYIEQQKKVTPISESLPQKSSIFETISVKVELPGKMPQAESLSGSEPAMHELLENKANGNSQNGRRGTAPQAMKSGQHDPVKELRLVMGTDINAQGGSYGNALQAASFKGHESVVKLLLDNGADINGQGGRYGSALQAASFKGHISVVHLLLDGGADLNAQGGVFGNALNAASSTGRESVVQLLLDKGANVNAQGGEFGTSLQAASYRGHESVVLLLLKKGADVNFQGGFHGNAIQAALYKGYTSIVNLLMERGAIRIVDLQQTTEIESDSEKINDDSDDSDGDERGDLGQIAGKTDVTYADLESAPLFPATATDKSQAKRYGSVPSMTEGTTAPTEPSAAELADVAKIGLPKHTAEKFSSSHNAEIASVFSVDVDIDSMNGSETSPLEMRVAAVHYLLQKLTNDQELWLLYQTAVKCLDEARFIRNNTRLLKRFFLDLGNTGNTPPQRMAVRFMRSRPQRTRISSEIYCKCSSREMTLGEQIAKPTVISEE
jgi:ankyrin repeat protein